MCLLQVLLLLLVAELLTSTTAFVTTPAVPRRIPVGAGARHCGVSRVHAVPQGENPSCSREEVALPTTPAIPAESPRTRRRAADGLNTRGGALRQNTVWSGLLAVAAMGAGAGAGGAAPARAATNSIQDADLPPVAFKTKSGLRYYDVRKGNGASPKWGQVAIIQYEGYVRASPFSKLVLFDDTYSRKTPYLVKHGNGRVIRGLDEGLHSMKLGGLRRIVVPLELGYTKTGLGPIPPNALRRKVLVRELGKAETNDPVGEIVYDVELVSLYDDEADLGYYDDLTFDPAYLQEGMAKSLQELRDKGVQVPSTKAFMTKPDILGSGRVRDADVQGLPENIL